MYRKSNKTIHIQRVMYRKLSKVQSILMRIGYGVTYDKNGVPRIISHGEFNNLFHKKF